MLARRFIQFFVLGCLFWAVPVFAQSIPSLSSKQIDACRLSAWNDYDKTIRTGLRTYRDQFLAEFDRQVGFRVRKAPDAASRVQRERFYAGDRALLQRRLDQLVATQTNNLLASRSEVMSRIPRLANPVAGFEKWKSARLSGSPLEAFAVLLENDLRRYANTEDRAIIRTIFGERRRGFWSAFASAFTAARGRYVERYLSCEMPADLLVPTGTPSAPIILIAPAPTTTIAIPTTPFPSASQTVSDFRVLSATLSVAPLNKKSCVQTYTLSASVIVSKPGVIKYTWEGEEGMSVPEQTVSVTGQNNTIRLTKTFGKQGPYSGWKRLRVTAPNALVSNLVSVAAPCDTAEATFTISGVKNELKSKPGCGRPAGFSGTIYANATGTATYTWIRSDGVQSDPKTIGFDGFGSRTVPYEWPLSVTSTRGWVQLRVLTPNVVYSEQVLFDATCTELRVLDAMVTASTTNRACLLGPLMAATIRTNLISGSMTYVWEYEDGFVSATQTASLPGKTGITSISVSSSRAIAPETDMWVRLRTISPNIVISEPVVMHMSCEPLRATNVVLTGDTTSTVSVCGTQTLNFTGSITTNKAGPVTYRFERSDTVTSAPETLVFNNAGTQTLRTAFQIGGNYSGWLKLHVMSPNDLLSEPANFQIVQACK